MLSQHLHFNFCLYVVSGLCIPKGTVKLKWPWLYFFYMLMSDLFVLINLITIGANFIAPDVPLAKRCYSGFTAWATAQSMIKAIACRLYKHYYAELFKYWDAIVEHDEGLKEVLLKNKTAIRRLTMCVFVFMVSPMIPWGSLPLFVKILSYFIPSLEGSYQFVAVPSRFPYDPLEPPAFEFTTLFQGLAAFAVNSKLIAYDCLIYGLLLSQIVLFKYLRTIFEHIISLIHLEQELGKPKDDLAQKYNAKLKQWVHKHCKLIKFCRSFNSLYSPMLLLLFFYNIFLLCSCAFFVTVAGASVTKLEIIFSSSYVIGTVVQLYTLCWLGDELTNQSITVTDDGFWQQFYVHSPRIHSSLRIIFEKTKKPLKISALGTFHLSIETFRSILGTAGSYFMVLNQIKK